MTHKVQIFASELVSCAQSSCATNLRDPMPLGPMDYATPVVVPIDIAFVYRKSEISDRGDISSLSGFNSELMPCLRFKRALMRVLDYYPQLTGRMQLRQGDKAVEMSKFGSGALLVSATCTSSLHDLIPTPTTRLTQLHMPDGGNALIPEQETTNEEIFKNPVLRVQHTRFACGSVAVGIRICHTLCDAEGLFQLTADLAEIYRQMRKNEFSSPDSLAEAHLPSPPVIEPYLSEFYRASATERSEALRYQPWNLSVAEPPSTSASSPSTSSPEHLQSTHRSSCGDTRQETSSSSSQSTAPSLPHPTPNTGRIARVTRCELEYLKDKASDALQGVKFTAFESLAAHIHQQVLRARVRYAKSIQAPLDSISTRHLFSVNQRRADRLNFPNRYFPNAPICTFDSPPYETIEGPLSNMASSFHDALTKITPENAEMSLRWISALPDKTLLRMPFMGQKLFTFTQWSGFNAYKGMDFDCTSTNEPITPILFFRPFSPLMLGLDGLCHIMPTEDQLNELSSSSRGSPSLDLTLIIAEPLWNFLDPQDRIMSKFLYHSNGQSS